MQPYKGYILVQFEYLGDEVCAIIERIEECIDYESTEWGGRWLRECDAIIAGEGDVPRIIPVKLWRGDTYERGLDVV